MLKFTKQETDGGIVVNYLKQSAIARSAKEAEEIINTFRRGKGSLECNDFARRYLRRLFAGEELRGNEIRTAGCGPHPVRFFAALAPTIEEHEARYAEACRKRREAAIEESRRLTEELLARFNEPRRGRYEVTVALTALTADTGKRRHLGFSGITVANSMMDAFNKASREELRDFCASKGLLFESSSPWNGADTEVTFLGED